MANSINDIQEELISEFEFFDDWMEKYDYIISLGKSMPVSYTHLTLPTICSV